MGHDFIVTQSTSEGTLTARRDDVAFTFVVDAGDYFVLFGLVCCLCLSRVGQGSSKIMIDDVLMIVCISSSRSSSNSTIDIVIGIVFAADRLDNLH